MRVNVTAVVLFHLATLSTVFAGDAELHFAKRQAVSSSVSGARSSSAASIVAGASSAAVPAVSSVSRPAGPVSSISRPVGPSANAPPARPSAPAQPAGNTPTPNSPQW